MRQFINNRNLQIFFVFTSFLMALIYIVTTNHIWEDFYITFRHSKNLVDGNGLVYQPGERVHGFTSVINTLLPALFYWLTGKSFILTIWLYRIVSIVALVAGGLFFLREIQKQNPNNFVIPLFFTLLFSFQIKMIMFATNGQEAGFMVLFLLPSIIFAFNGYKEHWKWAGICWAGLIYTRPDGPVYIMLLVIAAMILGQSKTKEELIAIAKAGIVCTIIYLPWFIGAWLYYGSPIPHTITAKSGMGGTFSTDIIYSLETIISNLPHIGIQIAEPTYFFFGDWPYWIKVYAFFSWIVCTIYWLIPSQDRLGRFVSLLYTLLVVYLSYLQFRGAVYPWYLPPAEVMAAFILCSAAYHISHKLTKSNAVPIYLINILLLYISSSIYFSSLSQIKVQQEVIETNHRKEIGLWLNKNKQVNDTVFLEPLGYIGYYSNAKMYDWPGLVSPKVVAAEKHKKAGQYAKIILALKPSWLVLRPNVIPALKQTNWFEKHYKATKIFDVSEEIKSYKNLSGKNYLYYDSIFIVYKKI